MYPFGCGCPTHNCNEVAISLAQSANIAVAKSNNITHEFVHITFIALRLVFRLLSCAFRV